jgi:hypothetical protein
MACGFETDDWITESEVSTTKLAKEDESSEKI